MIADALRYARAADGAIERRFGTAYQAIMGIGLVAEIIRRLHEGPHLGSAGGILSVVAVVFFCVLLLHQLAELAERLEHRRKSLAGRDNGRRAQRDG